MNVTNRWKLDEKYSKVEFQNAINFYYFFITVDLNSPAEITPLTEMFKWFSGERNKDVQGLRLLDSCVSKVLWGSYDKEIRRSTQARRTPSRPCKEEEGDEEIR